MVKDKRERNRSSDSNFSLVKEFNIDDRQVHPKPECRKGFAMDDQDEEANSPISMESDDDDFGNFKIAVG